MTKERIYQGIIVYRRDMGEKDRLLDVITRDEGVVSILAKGAKNPAGKLSGNIEKYQLVEFSTSRGKNWDILKEARLVTQWITSPLDLQTLRLLDEIASMIQFLKRFDEVSPLTYEQLILVLKQLSNLQIGTIWFKLQTLKHQGVMPILTGCHICNRSFNGTTLFFNTSSGTFLCGECEGINHSPVITVDPSIMKLFIALLNAPKPPRITGSVDPQHAGQTMNIIMKYYLEM